MIAQADGDGDAEDSNATAGEKSRGTEDTTKDDQPAVPGAVVALIFGVFGILVVARRSLR